MSEDRFEAMLNAIAGYELAIEDLRGTRKLGQNKPGRIAAAADGLEPFDASVAALMREAGR
jgi:predicted FMN-binding regulatory protein PaiB